MQNNLKIKILVIVVVILACIYGIIGLPTSKEQLVANWQKNIHLGLDLKGGSQLVLQVQIQDAFKAEAAQVVERLREELGKAGINYSSIDNTEPTGLADADKVQVNVKGIPPEKSGTLRSICCVSTCPITSGSSLGDGADTTSTCISPLVSPIFRRSRAAAR